MHSHSRGNFRWLWTASTASALGDGLATAALPLLMLSVTRDPVLIASLQAALGLPWLLFGLHAGLLADLWDRRRILWMADLLRLLVAGTIGGLAWADLTTWWTVLVLAFVYSIGTIAFRSAAPALLPSVVAPEQIVEANSRLQFGTTGAASFVGPGLGGLLFTLTTWVPFATQALSFLVSVICLRRLSPPTTQELPADRGPSSSAIRAGVTLVLRNRVLRVLAVGTTLLAASTGMLMAILALFVVSTIGAPQVAYGLVFTVYSISSLAVAPLVARLHRELGGRRLLVLSGVGGTVGLSLMAAYPHVAGVAAGMLVLGAATMVYNVLAVSLRQRHSPDAMLGRVSSVYNLLGVGSAPIAAPIAGWIATSSVTAAVWTSAGLAAAATLALLVGLPSRREVDGQLHDADRAARHPEDGAR
ncbi:MFS transporter [soil metagenome]